MVCLKAVTELFSHCVGCLITTVENLHDNLTGWDSDCSEDNGLHAR